MSFEGLSERLTYILFIGKHIDFPHSQTSMVLKYYSLHCLIFRETSVFFSYAFHLLMEFYFYKITVRISCGLRSGLPWLHLRGPYVMVHTAYGLLLL